MIAGLLLMLAAVALLAVGSRRVADRFCLGARRRRQAKRLGAVLLALSFVATMLAGGGLLAFIMTWNNFLFAFLLTSTAEVKTLPVIMRQFALGEPAVWGVSAAGALISTLPVALIFLLFQKMLMSGLAAGAVKG